MIQRPLTSLATARTGEAVTIERILFGGLRTLCSDLGLHEGDTVRCQVDGPGQMFLRNPTGRVVTLEREWARFIEVRRGMAAPADMVEQPYPRAAREMSS